MDTVKTKIIKYISFILFFILFNGCGSEKNGRDGLNKIPTPEKSTYNVEYSDNTYVVDEEIMGSLISSDIKTGVYKFKSDADELLDLNPSEIVFFYGNSVRRVNTVAEEDDEIVVYTEYVTLNEAIKNGTIGWENKIDWSSEKPEVKNASLIIGDAVFASETESELKLHFEGKLKGWNLNLDLVPKDNKLTIDLTAKKETEGQQVCTISGKGFISQFTNECHFTFVDSKLENFELVNHGINGELEIKFAAVALGTQVAQLEVPLKLKMPTVVYGIPVSLNLGCNLKVYPEVGQGASSQASYKLVYDSNMGFKFADNSAEANSKLNSQNMEVTGETVSAGAITTGVGVGLEFPRFEIAVLGETIVPYFLFNTAVTTFYEPGIASNVPPCQEGKMTLKCVSGVDLKFLGVSYAFYKDHFKKEKKWQTEGSQCED